MEEIVHTKSALVHYCGAPSPSVDDYLGASAQLSECIDNIRIVYANVGETDELIGLYPYEPLHDMRKAFESIDPRLGKSPTSQDRVRTCDHVKGAFNAIREHFLDEFENSGTVAPYCYPEHETHAQKRSVRICLAIYKGSRKIVQMRGMRQADKVAIFEAFGRYLATLCRRNR